MAIENPGSQVYGFQFHPEVMHTDGGMDMLKHMLVTLAGVKPDWTMDHVLEGQLRAIAEQVGARGWAWETGAARTCLTVCLKNMHASKRIHPCMHACMLAHSLFGLHDSNYEIC